MSRPVLRLAVPLLVTLALAACGGGSGSDGGSDGAAATTTTKPTYAGVTAADITFHPVEEILACDGGDYPLGEATTAPAASDAVPGVDGQLCYVLGPSGGDGSDVEDAKVYADGVGIEVAVRDDSVEQLNQLFNECFQATDACPTSSSDGRGYVAIVVDGRVISTPAITGEDLASSAFVITGDFDKTQATNIAAAINA
mgnify:CR=1 FL=1